MQLTTTGVVSQSTKQKKSKLGVLVGKSSTPGVSFLSAPGEKKLNQDICGIEDKYETNTWKIEVDGIIKNQSYEELYFINIKESTEENPNNHRKLRTDSSEKCGTRYPENNGYTSY
ncbi:hypothetical protein BB561_006575 [Smittium simulii]|uniref:Uncharacterized protein n=1 Tax=Smittium simulii TaxID=133385 RepID=A0A2T9Y352_9FUNG|nr:hypothetical protein BB561_006575 [Smittium simulii]